MTTLWHNRKGRAFTLVEMLVVIAIIAVLAALLLPALTRGKQRAQRIACIGNLNELGTAFQIFAHDHNGRYPMQTLIAEGGSEEFVAAGENINGVFYFSFRHLQTLANELVTPKILLCPADTGRDPAINFGSLQNSNISYFVGVDASYNVPASVLAGDRNVTNDASATASLVRGAFGLRWTRELHSLKGNVLFSDAHVEQMNNDHLDLPVSTASAPVLFLPPAVPPSANNPTYAPGGDPSTPLAPGGDAPSGTTIPQTGGQPPAPSGYAPRNAAASPPPAAPSPSAPPSRNGMPSSSTMTSHSGEPDTTITETDATENNDVAVKHHKPRQAAAPAADEEPEPPLLWLMGAAKALVAKSSWWLLLLLAFLIAAAFYLYARKKMRERRRP